MPRFDGGGVLANGNRMRVVRVRIPIGASGAIGAYTGDGVVSVTKTGTGDITVVLDQAFARYFGFAASIDFLGATTPSDGLVTIDPTNLTTTGVAPAVGAQSSVVIWTALAAAPTTAANLASGSAINIALFVSQSDH